MRIEDTDTARTVPGSEELIYDSLKWCGITPDEGVEQGGKFGPYKQSERKAIYQEHAQKLIENGKAYYAFDSEEEISAWRAKTSGENNGVAAAYNYATRTEMKNSLTLSLDEVESLKRNNTPYVIRLKIDATDDVVFRDIIRDEVHFKSDQLDDRVLLKSDGMPTYHLANVVDDYLMEISHVIRGEEWLASTPHHILLYRAFGWEDRMPSFAHLPLFLKPDGKGKLSKRDGDRLGFPVFCAEWKNPVTGELIPGFREKGFQPDAFVNFIAMLGWNDGTDQEIFSMHELIDSFSLERVHKAGAKFNFEKATWFNQQYIHHLPIETLVDYVKHDIQSINPACDDLFLASYCSLFQQRISFLYELKSIGNYLYGPIIEFDLETLRKKSTETVASFIHAYTNRLSEVPFEESTQLESLTKLEIESYNLSLGAVLPILRIGLTGITKGPSVFDTMMLLGKEESIRRLLQIQTMF